MNKISFFLIIFLSFSNAIKATENDDFHYFAIGEIPFQGGFNSKTNKLESKEIYSTDIEYSKNKEEFIKSESKLLNIWLKDNSVINGITFENKKIESKLLGTLSNEFGPLLKIDYKENDPIPPIYHTGDLDIQVVKPVEVKLSQLDLDIINSECLARGLELKYGLENSLSDNQYMPRAVWYGDQMDKGERNQIADPRISSNLKILTMAPNSNSMVLLAGCSYKGKNDNGDYYLPGPTLGYDRIYHKVVYRKFIDLDEHFTFLTINKKIYMLSYVYCNVCETSGWNITLFSQKHNEYERKSGSWIDPKDQDYDELIEYDAESLSSTISWFE